MVAAAGLNGEKPEGLTALAQVSLQAQIVHRAFEPLWANAQFADMFSFDDAASALAEPSIAHLFDDLARADPLSAWRRMIAGIGVFGRRTFHRRDGASFRAEMYARRIVWDGKEAIAMAILDVSCEERAIVELAEAKRDAECAALARRQLLAAAADDLQTPLLETIAALSAANADGPARNARTACRALLRHVEDALDAAARDHVAHAPRRLSFDAADLIRSTVESESADVRLTLHAPETELVGDRACLRALIRALLREGERRAAGKPFGCDAEIGPGGLNVCVHVAGGEDRDAEQDGLRAARALAAALGGVVIERRDAVWSALAFAPLPLAPRVARNAALEILVVDDQIGARRILEAALAALGHRPTLVASGGEALEALAERPFDLVLCDLNMPRLDGCETTRRIRRLPCAWSNLPVAAVTASSGRGVRDLVADAGMDALLEKPISIARLGEAIAALTACSVQPAEGGEIEHEHQDDEPEDEPERVHGFRASPKLSPCGPKRGVRPSLVALR